MSHGICHMVYANGYHMSHGICKWLSYVTWYMQMVIICHMVYANGFKSHRGH